LISPQKVIQGRRRPRAWFDRRPIVR